VAAQFGERLSVQPETRYARTSEGAVAYQVIGEGPLDLVAGSGIEFDDRGPHELKGVPGEWRVYAVRF
jgi:hypothetical protein